MKLRIVTVCVKGKPASNLTHNKKRKKILADVVKYVENKWENVDAILFPVDFFISKNISVIFHSKRELMF